MTSELERVCERLRIKIVARYGGAEVPEGWTPGTHPYKVTLRMGNRRLTTSFFMGPAHTIEPTAADVLACLASDARGGENTFEGFCADFGYDVDSRKAEATYKACAKMAKRLPVFLGEHFDSVANAEH
jgi:hypothetical protein